MRKLSRTHVAVALLAVASIVSLLGISLVGGIDPSVQKFRLMGIKPVARYVWYEEAPVVWGIIIYNPPIIVWGWIGKQSALCDSWGRGLIHLMVHVGLADPADEVRVELWGYIYNRQDMTEYFIDKEVWSTTFTGSYYRLDTTLYCPSDKFQFYTYGPSTANISLSFYMSV